MKKNQKKIYEQPTANPVEIVMKSSLLAGSTGNATNDGYGEGIHDGDNGWHD